MTDAHPRGDGLDPMFAGFSHLFEGSTEQAVQAWTRGVSIYAAHLEALGATKGPEESANGLEA